MITIQQAIKEFINHCKVEKNLSTKTTKAYFIDLKQMTKFLVDRNYALNISSINKHHLREYVESISLLKPKSIKRKVATIKALFNYLEFEDKVGANPLRKLRIRIKEPKVLPVVMDLGEIKQIFKVAYDLKEMEMDNDRYSYLEALRNVVVIELLFATGARVSEIADLKEQNIHTITGSITINGKGQKERIIQICNQESLNILRYYQSLFSESIKNSGGFFLTNRFGNKLSDQSIRTIVKNLIKKAGIKRNITPHKFRHTVATLLLENDVDIKYIQSILGHSSIMTTQIYTHVNREKQKQILTTKHPRREFSMVE